MHSARVASAMVRSYVDPFTRQRSLTTEHRTQRVASTSIREKLVQEYQQANPGVSKERTIAAVFKHMQDDRLNQSEIQPRATFRPEVGLTLRHRKRKEYCHTGVWGTVGGEKRECWSCCLKAEKEGPGCQSKVVDPDRWLLEGPAVV